MDNSIIDQVRQSNDIVDVINSYVPLKRSGSNWKGICPFHNDTNPSMQVSQTKQIFKCFACGKAGNVFTFVQEYERLTFMEAVKKLAQRTGIALPQYEKTKTVSTKRELLKHAYKSAKDHFCENLFTHGSSVLTYLNERKISSETAKQLELGYALNSEKGLLNHLLKEGITVSLLKESGLFGNYSGNLVDLFRERLMFPIHNNIGEVIAFGGRILSSKSEAGKYINSPGTELYTKGKELYGLFKTKYEIGKAKYAIVCEGYFDFLRLYEAGFVNSVASLGTALTEDQIYLLARYCDKIYMLYDGDKSGRSAAVRGALLCLGKGLNPFIVELPKDHDPDTFILEQGKDALQEKIDSAQSLIAYYAKLQDADVPVAERIERLLDATRLIKDPIRKELLIHEISEAFQISENALNSKLRLSEPKTPTDEDVPLQISSLKDYVEERNLLVLALKERNSYIRLADELGEDYFFNKHYKEIYKYLITKVQVDMLIDPSAMLDSLEDSRLREGLADLMFEELPEMRFDDTLKQVKIRKIQQDLDIIDRRINKEPHNRELLNQKSALARQYRMMTKKVVNKLLH